ncbi:recombinase family protein [Ciceribacter azotifigens]|uniref:recombinase family protein n=1 Tax=Ciceribacter azotifigens TaxID=2069303 RepID=UPI003A864C1E
MSPVRIAKELNARGVPGPRGRSWQGTAIRGYRNRRSGILNNQAYIGLIVFDRLAYRKSPATERRVLRSFAATVRPDGFTPRTHQGSASSALYAYRSAREPSPEQHYVPVATTKPR